MKIPVLYQLEQAIRKFRKSRRDKCKKIFIIGTAIHDNIGDAAISYAEICFAKKYFKDYVIEEINTYEYWDKLDYLKNAVKADDVIWCQGGGNLGNRYLNEEEIRRSVVSTFLGNKIFIFPQSIWFSEDEAGQKEVEISKKIYEANKNLTIFCRDPYSLSLAKKYFAGVKSFLTKDIVCSLSYEWHLRRGGVLACIRDFTDESAFSENEYNSCIQIVKSLPCEVRFSKNRYGGDIPLKIRKKVFLDELHKFAKSKVVITDRLHGVIFSIITKTNCIVLKSKDHKIPEFLKHLAGSNSVTYVGINIEQIREKALYYINHRIKSDYPNWDKDFKDLAKQIKEEIKNG